MDFCAFMSLEKNQERIGGLFSASGSFGEINGKTTFEKIVRDGKRYIFENGEIRLTASFEEYENGVMRRIDTLENISDKPHVLRNFFSRFVMEGYDYEVYTQFNGWQNENSGGWQPLVTNVTTAASGMRTCDDATPILALYNHQNLKTTVFHLIPNCRWKMTAQRRTEISQFCVTVIETGFEDSCFQMQVAPGEIIELPEVIFYVTDDRVSLGSEKLHEVYNRLYPRKSLPIMFNTWLLCFDNIDLDLIYRQVDAAQELGIEIFTVDAGWFGKGKEWSLEVGNWFENEEGAFGGKLFALSEYVRKKGMTFGLWMEPSKALPQTETAVNHPDYIFEDKFIDFANEEAWQYIFDVTCTLIDKYKLGFMKLDFNSTTICDPQNAAFYRYLEGERRYVMALKKKYPALHISSCAAGGYREDLGTAKIYDSYWISDNQGPYEGLTIYKDGIKRLPPSFIEKWNAQTFVHGVTHRMGQDASIALSCNNAVWTYLLNVSHAYTKAFLSGGPFGFSCDIASFPEMYKEELKAFIRGYKERREFYRTACAKVICDTKNIVAIEYFDSKYQEIEVHLFTKLVCQKQVTVYPVVEQGCHYRIGEEILDAEAILQNGIAFKALKDNDCQSIRLVQSDK